MNIKERGKNYCSHKKIKLKKQSGVNYEVWCKK